MLKDNNDCYSSVQNDESLHMDTVQMREESESGQESEKRCDLRRQQKMERGEGGSSDVRWKTVPQTSGCKRKR